MRPPTVDDATLAMAIVAVVIALIPWSRHFHLYLRLQISLITRLGAIWDETEGIRVPLLRTSFLAELDEIEQKYGDRLTGDEREWLQTSRYQHRISFKWSITVFIVLVLCLFAVMPLIRQ